MSVDNSKKVDAIGLDPQGKVQLTISDHLPWTSDNEHLSILQNKLNAYLEFLESGEVYETYPKAVGRNFTIQVALKYLPNRDGEEFLIRVGAYLYDLGYDFGYYQIKE